MSVKERILAIRLMEKQSENPEIMTKMGVEIKMDETICKEGEE